MTSWSRPRTWVAHEAVTSASLNTDLRDNLLNLSERLTLHGITSESALNQVKAAVCGVRLTNSSDQTISAGAEESLTWDTEATDSDGFHAGGQPARITIPAGLGGWYLVTVGIYWANGPGIVRLMVRDSSAATLARQVDNGVTTGTTAQTLTSMLYLPAGEWVYAAVSHDDASSVVVTKSASYTSMSAYRVFAA